MNSNSNSSSSSNGSSNSIRRHWPVNFGRYLRREITAPTATFLFHRRYCCRERKRERERDLGIVPFFFFFFFFFLLILFVFFVFWFLTLTPAALCSHINPPARCNTSHYLSFSFISFFLSLLRRVSFAVVIISFDLLRVAAPPEERQRTQNTKIKIKNNKKRDASFFVVVLLVFFFFEANKIVK